VGIGLRSYRRWKQTPGRGDERRGPKTPPANRLSGDERSELLRLMCLPPLRDLSPKQCVPRLLDQGIYLASEATIYRLLRTQQALRHRAAWQSPHHSHPRELVATAPRQVWTWDITFLQSRIRGRFFYLYVVLDLFSRKIIAWCIEEFQSGAIAARLLDRACASEGIRRGELSLHADNGGPMRSGHLLALLQQLGVATSFSRPGCSDDNPFIESLFRTLKYRPESGDLRFRSLDEARALIARLVHWYNAEHLHSAVGFVTPDQRHRGEDRRILEQRRRVLDEARRLRPERWAASLRNLTPVDRVVLNPTSNPVPTVPHPDTATCQLP
jgi:putative transposase